VSQIPLGLPLFPPRWDIGWSNPAGMVAEAQKGICSSQIVCFGSKNVHFD